MAVSVCHFRCALILLFICLFFDGGCSSSTALSGNDISSSALYTSGIVAEQAGIWSPICITLVVILLYFFRRIYTELVTALPLNGGTYTALLNTMPKLIAAIAACLSLLSYIATAVVSATSTMLYLSSIWSELPVVPAAIIVLALFCILCLIGMTESAAVALVIFAFHVVVLTLIIIFGFIESFKSESLII
jgi:amino acid transporter